MSGSSGRRKKTSGAAIVMAVVLFGGGWFLGKLAMESLLHPFQGGPAPTASAEAVVKDDPVVHKEFKRYAKKAGMTGTFRVSRPNAKTLTLAVKTTTVGEADTGREIGLTLAATWLYLKSKKARSDTIVDFSLTNGQGTIYNAAALGYAKHMQFGDLERTILDYLEQQGLPTTLPKG
jgi:hypothetical protein